MKIISPLLGSLLASYWNPTVDEICIEEHEVSIDVSYIYIYSFILFILLPLRVVATKCTIAAANPSSASKRYVAVPMVLNGLRTSSRIGHKWATRFQLITATYAVTYNIE